RKRIQRSASIIDPFWWGAIRDRQECLSHRVRQFAFLSQGNKGSGFVAVPVVAIVGRPNVGKSSLFNALAGKRIAIVEPTAGVTRDRVSALVKYEGRPFELVDTGGIGIVDSDKLTDQVAQQIDTAIDQADLIVF